MIKFYKITPKEVHALGKDFPWERPCPCAKCKSKFWGHGYVARFFNEINGAVYMKRWICSGCGVIIICRPRSFWKRYQESIENIFKTLAYRLTMMAWPPWVSRQRGGHWMNKFLKKVNFEKLIKENLLDTITFFQNKNISLN
jgi:hypothetical protein